MSLTKRLVFVDQSESYPHIIDFFNGTQDEIKKLPDYEEKEFVIEDYEITSDGKLTDNVLYVLRYRGQLVASAMQMRNDFNNTELILARYKEEDSEEPPF